MKAIHLIFSIMLMCCMLVSCNQNEPNQEEMKQTAQELATFLSDNYQEGDSVFFVTETGETEGFVVQVSEFFPMQISNEPDFGEDVKFILEGYRIATALKSKNTLLFVKLELNSFTPPVYPEVNGTVRINGDWGDSNVEPITTVKEDIVYIDNGDMHCTLAKNVGLVQVSGKGHTWTLKQ